MELLESLRSLSFYNNTLQEWLLSIAIALALSLLLGLGCGWVTGRLHRLAQRSRNQLDDVVAAVLSETRLSFLVVVSLLAASQLLTLGPRVGFWVRAILIVSLLYQVAIWGNVIIRNLLRHYVHLRMETEAERVASLAALTFLARLVLWSVIVLVGLQNLGVEVTALVTSLGIGGIAIALAVQNLLGDLAASLAIMFDKPFVVGDFVVVDDCSGTIEKIGMKTTRIRSLSGEQMIFSNSDLINSRLRNFKRLQERRHVVTIGVTYQTPYEKLQQIPTMIREIVEAEKQVIFDRSHFKSYGDSALIFEFVYRITVPDYQVFMDVQQSINLALYRQFEQEGIEFAYPTQTLYLVREPGGRDSFEERSG